MNYGMMEFKNCGNLSRMNNVVMIFFQILHVHISKMNQLKPMPGFGRVKYITLSRAEQGATDSTYHRGPHAMDLTFPPGVIF